MVAHPVDLMWLDKIGRFLSMAVYKAQRCVQDRLQRYIPLVLGRLNVMPSSISLVIGTKRGLLVIHDRLLVRVYAGSIYGVAVADSRIFFYEDLHTHGRILSVRYSPGGRALGQRIAIEIDRLPSGGHQLDVYRGELYLMNTYENAVTRIALHRGEQTSYYPNGVLNNGRSSDNYNHFNSINVTPMGYCILAHNETAKTKRKSEIWYLDDRFNKVKVTPTNASSGHNIAHLFGSPLFCDSLNGTLIHNDRVVFRADTFTRGLSLAEDYTIVGGSDYGSRAIRDSLGGWIYLLHAGSLRLFRKVRIPGMVQEIRRIDQMDYATMRHQSQKNALRESG